MKFDRQALTDWLPALVGLVAIALLLAFVWE
jgi:hypothetical protein